MAGQKKIMHGVTDVLRKAVALVATALGLGTALAGNVYYASPTGTASGKGTEASPYDIATAMSKPVAGNGDEVRLLKGTYALTSAQLPSVLNAEVLRGMGNRPADVVLEGNGVAKTITLVSSGQIQGITFRNFGATALSIRNSDVAATSVVSKCVFTAHANGNGCAVSDKGPVLLSDCTFTDNTYSTSGYGTALSSTDPNLRLVRCTFANNVYSGWSKLGGAAIYSCGGIRLDSCVVSNNTATGVGGGIYVWGGTGDAYFTNTVFHGNSSSENGGGGVYATPQAGQTCTFVDCTFRTNSTTSVCGGGVRIDGHGAAVFRNCRFTDNFTSGASGPALAANAGYSTVGAGLCTTAVRLEGCTFLRNRAQSGCGACEFLTSEGLIDITNCVFRDNHATSMGGAIAFRGPNSLGERERAQITDCVFEDNTSWNCGGAIGQDYASYARVGLVAGVTNCVFRNNHGVQGGAVQAIGCSFSGCLFEDNSTARVEGSSSSPTFGGAIIVYARGQDLACNPDTTNFCEIAGCTFRRNVTHRGGAVYMQHKGFYSVRDCVFEDNWGTNICGTALTFADRQHTVEVDRCKFFRNAGRAYGALGFTDSATTELRLATVRNCLFVANTNLSDYAGAMVVFKNVQVENCTFVRNVSTGSGGAIWGRTTDGTCLKNCIFYDNRLTWNRSAAYCDIEGQDFRTNASYCCTSLATTFLPERHNILSANPRFVSLVADDYRLRGGSCCLDAGINADWMAGARDLQNLRTIPRIINGTVDMGAYEYQHTMGFMMVIP